MRGRASSDIVTVMKLWVLGLGLLLQAAPDEGGARLYLTDRTDLRGEIAGLDASGMLDVQTGSGPRRVAVEEILKIQFAKEGEAVRFDGDGERARLFHGGTLSGKIKSCTETGAVVETAAGVFRLRRADIKSLTLGSLSGLPPELRDERKDILVREIERVEKKEDGKEKTVRQAVAVYGRLKSIGEKVLFRVMPVKKPPAEGAPPDPEPAPAAEEDREFDRASVKQVYFHHERPPGELPAGWFAKILFRNGDKLVGVLRGFDEGRVRVFSHLFGSAEIERKHIHTIAFVQYARMTVGNILICDQNGVHEYDRQGNVLWSYTQNTQYAWSARKLENGNVLVANTNNNQVLELKPVGKSGADIHWQINNSNYPYDAVRLENGNTLVAEYYSNRVVEYDARTQEVVWQCGAVNYPISVQRLDNGRTLICSNHIVAEVDKDGTQQWKAEFKSNVRPWRAQRLENGNTLVTDYQRGQVIEIDAKSNEVWRMDNLSRPVQAIRLEDGNTLILEQGKNHIIEVDPSKRFTVIIKNLNTPQGMSTY